MGSAAAGTFHSGPDGTCFVMIKLVEMAALQVGFSCPCSLFRLVELGFSAMCLRQTLTLRAIDCHTESLSRQSDQKSGVLCSGKAGLSHMTFPQICVPPCSSCILLTPSYTGQLQFSLHQGAVALSSPPELSHGGSFQLIKQAVPGYCRHTTPNCAGCMGSWPHRWSGTQLWLSRRS